MHTLNKVRHRILFMETEMLRHSGRSLQEMSLIVGFEEMGHSSEERSKKAHVFRKTGGSGYM